MRAEYIIGLVNFILIVAGLVLLFLFPSDNSNQVLLGENTKSYIEIVSPSGFVNTKSVTIEEYIGKKVVLIDFMTYSCINCQRTFPYVNAWYEKYKNQGLEIIGIHTPEFAFEKDIDNVQKAMKQYGIMYPIVLDNEYATWNAYGNHYWPRKYLIDIHGNIVYDHIGEGAYEETERKIQELLIERASYLNEKYSIDSAITEATNSDVRGVRTPELYFGSLRNNKLAGFVSGKEGVFDFTNIPPTALPDTLYLEGVWNITPEFAQNNSSQARIVLRYSAKSVFFVASADVPVNVKVIRDGHMVQKEVAGEDVRDGMISIQESGLYRLIQDDSADEHVLELIIENPGLRAFTFTFG